MGGSAAAAPGFLDGDEPRLCGNIVEQVAGRAKAAFGSTGSDVRGVVAGEAPPAN